MSSYALAPLTKGDIFEIWCYMAEDDESAADRVENAIYAACAVLAERPLQGHTRSDITKRSLRFWTLTRYPNYTIAYWPDVSPLLIIAVLHGKRKTRGIIKARGAPPK